MAVYMLGAGALLAVFLYTKESKKYSAGVLPQFRATPQEIMSPGGLGLGGGLNGMPLVNGTVSGQPLDFQTSVYDREKPSPPTRYIPETRKPHVNRDVLHEEQMRVLHEMYSSDHGGMLMSHAPNFALNAFRQQHMDQFMVRGHSTYQPHGGFIDVQKKLKEGNDRFLQEQQSYVGYNPLGFAQQVS